MTGGIVQIAVYGAQDIFLTGTPQITFFKVVYRRHTNFSIESIQQQFIGVTNFGYEMSSVIDKIGDLMHKVYLEIELPEINLTKHRSNYNIDHNTAKLQFSQAESYYKLICSYITSNVYIARQLYDLLKTDNVSMQEINLIMSNPKFINRLENSRSEIKSYILNTDNYDLIPILVKKKEEIYHTISRLDVQILFNSIKLDDQCKREKLLIIIKKQLYCELQNIYLNIYNIYLKKKVTLDEWNCNSYVERYEFAWVEEIGNAIIDQIDVKIGPEVIDRHTGDWMILYNKITLNEYQKVNYEKMIGQVPQLIKFDDCIKPRYKLVIPLSFWFNKYTGLALPLIALRYHDVMINLRLKDLNKLCYVSDTTELSCDIPAIQSEFNINIQSAVLYVDYIFLDSDERRRFAQSSHEYLIETVQYNEFCIGPSTNANTHLVFSHPCRYMIFFCQPNQYRANPTGRNKCQWNNFATNFDKSGQPVSNAFIRLNSTDITDSSQPIEYFNYVQPYMYFTHSPTDGQYVYSFSINPMEIQPNGSCNFSRIDDVSIEYKFSEEFIKLVNSNIYESDGIKTGIYIATYVLSYNILRFISGMAGLAFQTSI